MLMCVALRVHAHAYVPVCSTNTNRYAGRSIETVAAAEAREGQLLVKGVRAVWRQSAPYIQNTLMASERKSDERKSENESVTV